MPQDCRDPREPEVGKPGKLPESEPELQGSVRVRAHRAGQDSESHSQGQLEGLQRGKKAGGEAWGLSSLNVVGVLLAECGGPLEEGSVGHGRGGCGASHPLKLPPTFGILGSEEGSVGEMGLRRGPSEHGEVREVGPEHTGGD